MKVVFVDNLLVNTNIRPPDFALYPHLGLISLIAVAENAGHNCVLYDPKLAIKRGRIPFDETLYRAMADDILALHPDVVGFTTLGCNFICTLKTAAHIKSSRPDLPIILGGPHATILDRVIITKFAQFDVVVRNEAELKLLPLLDGLSGADLRDVPGITYRHGSETIANVGEPAIEDLDQLPHPRFDAYPIDQLRLKRLHVEAGRGCPFKCTFCSTASFFGRRYRVKSPRRLCEELDYLNRRYGISDFSLTHDLFTVDKHKVRAFCDEVGKRQYSWTCSARMDCVDADLLKEMSRAGCKGIYYGVETGSLRLQRAVEKRLDLSLFHPMLDLTTRLGMTATASFITGYPQETADDQGATLNLLGEAFSYSETQTIVQLHLLTPEPGTHMLTQFGNLLQFDGHVSDFNFPTMEVDDAEVMAANPDVFMNHHYYRGVLPRERHVFVTSLFHALYPLGFPLLAHIIGCYDGKLSRLVDAMEEYRQAECPAAPVEPEFVLKFFEARWSDHYLMSLVGYMVKAHLLTEPTQPHANAARTRPVDSHDHRRDTVCRQSSGTALLRNVHNCVALLRCLQQPRSRNTPLPSEMLTERVNLLLVRGEGEGGVRNFVLSEGVASLIEFFVVERTLGQASERFSGDASDVDAVVAALIKMGALSVVTRGHASTLMQEAAN